MKQFLIIIILTSCSIQSIAQRSLVANPKNNFIYNGLYTPIQVMIPICEYDSLSVSASHGDFKRILDNYYAWTVCESKKVQLFIFIKAYQNGQVVYEDQSEFRLKFVPNPVAIVSCGSRHNGRRHISECNGIASIFTDLDYEVFCQVQEYRVKILRDGVIIHEWDNDGSRFEVLTRNQLQRVITGDIVIFSKIKTLCDCENRTRTLDDVELIV